MEHKIKYNEEDLEDGELTDSSDDGYTPLQRPETKSAEHPSLEPMKMEETLDDIEDSPSEFGQSSDSSTDSDDDFKVASRINREKSKKKKRRTVLLRVKSKDALQENQTRFKKYNIWTESLQEESLMENMRGFDVAKYNKNDRSVENYDFSLKYRLNGEKKRKRRISTSGDEYSDGGYYRQNKRPNYTVSKYNNQGNSTLGRKLSTSSTDSQNSPRYILDLVAGLESDSDEIARDIANKLCEEKDDLLLRVVEVLGKEVPIEIFKETQKIERDGGMMVMNGKRRRTPGGVFLFLLKHNDNISNEDKKKIFNEQIKKSAKEKKTLQAINRDKKVEELKKRLSLKEKELVPLSSRAELASSYLKPETHATLSNPPPSPVTNGGQENSPEYSSHAINHVTDGSPEKFLNRSKFEGELLTAYDDDFLDMNCDDMDMF